MAWNPSFLDNWEFPQIRGASKRGYIGSYRGYIGSHRGHIGICIYIYMDIQGAIRLIRGFFFGGRDT